MEIPISIIVPIYNTEKYLHRCIDSILAQTFTDFELILVDDGSTDGCPRICDEYASKDSRIKVIHKANEGVAAARKTGFEATRGEYIGWVDSDDWIEMEMYEVLYSNACKHNADLVICGFFREIKNGKSKSYSFGEKVIIAEKMVKFALYVPMYWNKLAKRSLFFVNGCLDFPIGITDPEDMYVTFRLFHFSVNSICVRNCLYHHVKRENSITNQVELEEKIAGYSFVFSCLEKFCFENHIEDRYKLFIQYQKFAIKLSYITEKKYWDIKKWLSLYPGVQDNIWFFPVNCRIRLFVFLINHRLTKLGFLIIKMRRFLADNRVNKRC
jgi:glycosyltransferase involved in cell wall biosynthesis